MSENLYKIEYNQRAKEFLSKGRSVESFAGSIGVARDTVYGWKEQHPDFERAIEEGLDNRKQLVEEMLIGIGKGEKGNVSAAIFLAKNWAGMRDDHGVHLTSGASLSDLFKKASKT